jgi:hypothetical protein
MSVRSAAGHCRTSLGELRHRYSGNFEHGKFVHVQFNVFCWQVTQLVQTPKLLVAVLDQLENGPWVVKKEAAWIVGNIATGSSGSKHGKCGGNGDDEAGCSIKSLVKLGAVGKMSSLLSVQDGKTIDVALDFLKAILEYSSVYDLEYQEVVEECGGLEKMESLQEHSNEEIAEKAEGILETHFQGSTLTFD